MTLGSSVRGLIQAGQQWSDNNDLRWGAGLAYYALFSIAPVLILAVDLAGLVFDPATARTEVRQQLRHLLDPDAADMIGKLVEAASEQDQSLLARVLSYGVLLAGALGVFLHIRAALCHIWRLDPPSKNGLLATLIDYLLALVMVVLVGVLLMASLLAGMVLPVLRAFLQGWLPAYERFLQLVELAVSAGFLTLLFAATYRVLSGRRIPWGCVWYGAAIAAVLFTFGKTLLGYYLVFTGTASAYGAAGSLVVFLVWIYYSSQVLFFGAELIQARRGCNVPAAPPAK